MKKALIATLLLFPIAERVAANDASYTPDPPRTQLTVNGYPSWEAFYAAEKKRLEALGLK